MCCLDVPQGHWVGRQLKSTCYSRSVGTLGAIWFSSISTLRSYGTEGYSLWILSTHPVFRRNTVYCLESAINSTYHIVTFITLFNNSQTTAIANHP